MATSRMRLSREQLVSLLILDGWVPMTHVSIKHAPYPVLVKVGHNMAVCGGSVDRFARHMYYGDESWLHHFIPMLWEDIDRKHMAAIRVCLEKENVI